jgi:hypothetical protein
MREIYHYFHFKEEETKAQRLTQKVLIVINRQSLE